MNAWAVAATSEVRASPPSVPHSSDRSRVTSSGRLVRFLRHDLLPEPRQRREELSSRLGVRQDGEIEAWAQLDLRGGQVHVGQLVEALAEILA